MHARSKKNFNFIIIWIYILPYLLNNSQTIHSTIDFSKPLLCVTLICGYWSDFIWSGVCELSAALCTTIIGETAIYNAPKAVPSGKEWICIFIQTNTKIKFPRSAARNKWTGNILMFHVDVNTKRLGICFKKRLLSMIQRRLFLLRHGALSDLKLWRMFSFT